MVKLCGIYETIILLTSLQGDSCGQEENVISDF
jgi:hypothetical protein